MMRQSSSRNQRSKGGLRLRHFLQICLLLAICIWLVYQVKHSREKKRAFEERKVIEEQPFPFRFGQKDLPSVKENKITSETRKMDEDEVEGQEVEDQEQDINKEDAQDEEGKADVDDWIDEQDQDKQREENEQEEFKNVEEKEVVAEEADSVDSLEHEGSAMNARKDNYKIDDVSHYVAHETHMHGSKTGNADASGLDEEKPDIIGHADMKGNSSNETVLVSSKSDSNSTMGDFNGFMSNLSSIALGENINLSEAAKHPMNVTSSVKNGSDFRFLKHENSSILNSVSGEENIQKELQTATLTMGTAIPKANASESLMETANNSTVADSLSYRVIEGNETASLIPDDDQNHTIENATSRENYSKLVDSVVELEQNPKSKTSEEQESEHHFTTTFFSKNEVMSHNAVTEEEREARTDLSTLPEIQSDIRHDYDDETTK